MGTTLGGGLLLVRQLVARDPRANQGLSPTVASNRRVRFAQARRHRPFETQLAYGRWPQDQRMTLGTLARAPSTKTFDLRQSRSSQMLESARLKFHTSLHESEEGPTCGHIRGAHHHYVGGVGNLPFSSYLGAKKGS